MIDWSKLKPYNNDSKKSFEELCYQIAKVLYGDKGSFTSVDDSGGGDGVEFYLTFPNGKQWGWQAKFYYPDLRLGTSNRKSSIKGSLKKACKEHPNLKKWFLCTPTNFTTGEKKWFDEILSQSIPDDSSIELIHWNDSDFNSWLSEPKFFGKKNYFFGELELDIDWFKMQYEKQTASIGNKFNPMLHIEPKVKENINQILCNQEFVESLTETVNRCKSLLANYQNFLGIYGSYKNDQLKWKRTYLKALAVADTFDKSASESIFILEQTLFFLNQRSIDYIKSISGHLYSNKIKKIRKVFFKLYEKSKFESFPSEDDRNKVEQEKKDTNFYNVSTWLSNISAELDEAFCLIDLIKQSDLHIFGDAGVGKTHLACNTVNRRLEVDLPALLVLGNRLNSDRSLEEQLRGILDIPPSYSWHDFLQALEAAAEAYGTRIPIVIDSLNESICNGIFSQVWESDLPGLIAEIDKTKNIVLITTCRTTYKDAIWNENTPSNIKYLSGFDYDNVELAVEKYFDFYKIKADLTGTPLNQFQHPIYLQIFCQSQNPDCQEEKYIYVGEQTLYELFENYFKQCNITICKKLGIWNKTPIIINVLQQIAEYLWINNERLIPIEKLAELIDKQSIDSLQWEKSKTKAILDEGLIACRDWGDRGEVIYFTYDLLGGYLIANYLLKNISDDIKAFINSEKITTKLFSKDSKQLHPLYEDISKCLAGLIPVKTGRYLHQLTDNKTAFNLSVNAIFEIPSDKINQSCINLLAQLFTISQNQQRLLELSFSTIAHVLHPLNAEFWSEQLKGLSMPERDISWTEHIRSNSNWFENTIIRFELICRKDETQSDMMQRRLNLLAKYIMWVLTSTIRPLRDKATNALYWYGRKYPEQLLDLTLYSLEINDPYVSERMLAAVYGVAMARQYDFQDSSFANNVLPLYGKKLFEAIFKPDAPYSTTHILARDYAKGTIEIALIHHPDLLNKKEKQRIVSPFIDGGIRVWEESEEQNTDLYKDGNCPLHPDFENYTLGRLVRGRSNYDFQHNEYKKVKANIIWRIYNLGYSINIFGEIDKLITRYNWNQKDHLKTDRYGKKYSWIAFYELAGFRQDNNLLPFYDDLRISDVDIDPSFPEELQEFNLVQADFLGDRNIPTEQWILNGGIPNINSYLIANSLCGESADWVLLHGYIDQDDKDANRGSFIIIRGFVVNKNESDNLLQRLEKQDLSNRWLPEISEDHFTYAEEITWRDTFSGNGFTELDFKINYALVRNGEPVSNDEADEFLESVSEIIDTENEQAFEAALKKRNLELVEKTVEEARQLTGHETFKVLISVRNNNWGDYHSQVNPGQGITIPAKEIIENLDLYSQPQTFDLFEKDGNRASITFCYGDASHSIQHFTFLRKDLLESFLSDTESELIWATWGERQFSSSINNASRYNAFYDRDERNKSPLLFQKIQAYKNMEL